MKVSLFLFVLAVNNYTSGQNDIISFLKSNFADSVIWEDGSSSQQITRTKAIGKIDMISRELGSAHSATQHQGKNDNAEYGIIEIMNNQIKYRVFYYLKKDGSSNKRIHKIKIVKKS